ncbi:hypothetical protein RIF29_40406 [Crotalaria pallida]|uniref:Transcription repressor n=1 Tax=Crotalaria pallida TaxID=3830 RepID=A0AAN9E3G5_CROPI
MKWGEKKPSLASSSTSSSSHHHASPFHWLSKFKNMSIKHKAKQKSPSSIGSPRCSFVNGGRLYGGDDHDNDNALIMESFCEEEGHEDNRSNAMKHGKREGTPKLKKKDNGVGEETKLLNDKKVSHEMEEYNREKEYESLRRRFEKKAQTVLKEQLLKLEKESKEVEKDVMMKFESPTTICTPRTHSFVSSASSKDSSLRSIVENRVFNSQNFEKIERPSQKKLSYEGQSLRQIEELKIKTNKQKQLVHHVSREIQRRKPKHSKVRIYSPRLASKVEFCKIKALEDMRKARLKVKKKEMKEIVEETEGIDSFAVIKCSTDPKKDFRDSMIEMITEKQISQPEEMEELLACYLTLNADEYHDLIIKVFRQLWFDMKDGLCIKSDMSCYFGYD